MNLEQAKQLATDLAFAIQRAEQTGDDVIVIGGGSVGGFVGTKAEYLAANPGAVDLGGEATGINVTPGDAAEGAAYHAEIEAARRKRREDHEAKQDAISGGD
jgi:hypothetical protein